LRLKKALYGLRQASRAWYSKLHVSLTSLNFMHNDHEYAVYTRRTGNKPLVAGVYVDDLLIAGALDSNIEVFKQEMWDWFKMSDLGLLSYYLRIEVHQEDSGIILCQSALRVCWCRRAWGTATLASLPWKHDYNWSSQALKIWLMLLNTVALWER
jgi:hypothetical protein